MYRGTSRYYKVVYDHDEQLAVWHADAGVLAGWHETGRYGTEDECWDYIETCQGEQGYLFSAFEGVLQLG